MIVINKDINPEREIYYLGAVVIEILKSMPSQKVNMLDAFQLLNKRKRVSINLFALTMDWLYMIGSINHREGDIVKCF